MYNYKKTLPKGFNVEKEIIKGSSAKVFILTDDKGNKLVRKISDVEGVNKNGKQKLRKEINFLEYFHSTRTMDIYPQIYTYEFNDAYVYYDMSFIEGKTLQELLNENKKEDVIKCCYKVINDLCFYSNIRRTYTDDENVLMYKFYLDKTKKVIDNLVSNDMVADLVQKENIIINNEIYKNAQAIIDYFYEDKVQNKLISSTIAFCFLGDLITSNIFYDNGNVNYIDPRGDFGNFDICYDIAKMKFSFSGYDQVDNNDFVLSDDGNSINFQLNNGIYSDINGLFFTILRKNEMFSDNVIKQDGYWKERIRLHTALQYINNSYIQLERNCLDKFKIMYSIGTIKLNELLNRLY